MKKWAFYNDVDPYVCAWARNLIGAGLALDGKVDNRPIQEVSPADVENFIQCHFFCGILGWSYALRLAGWPDDAEVWTGSCPCQPFSCAGRGRAEEDERHLWPAFRRLVSERRPPVVFGEQVASKAGREWLAGVRADLEDVGYRVGAADLCAAGVGAPHIRQRLFWVADSNSSRWTKTQAVPQFSTTSIGIHGTFSRLADSKGCGSGAPWTQGEHGAHGSDGVGGSGELGGLADAERGKDHEEQQKSDAAQGGRRSDRAGGRGVAGGPWDTAVWIPCADGKARRVESGLECLVDGLPFRLADGRTVEGSSRAGILRGLGNAIVTQVAAEFIRAYMETRQ